MGILHEVQIPFLEELVQILTVPADLLVFRYRGKLDFSVCHDAVRAIDHFHAAVVPGHEEVFVLEDYLNALFPAYLARERGLCDEEVEGQVCLSVLNAVVGLIVPVDFVVDQSFGLRYPFEGGLVVL
ncbi:MAG: hypothetical protein Udaeo2_25440 [Candidatus Udaeobacter sp.]|nr:MAG: hypothetical protein Udaeo2_25440 [Candidatus Udaeobacter sp.]